MHARLLPTLVVIIAFTPACADQDVPPGIDTEISGSPPTDGADDPMETSAGDDAADDTTTGGPEPDDCAPPEGGYFAAEGDGALVPDGPSPDGVFALGLDLDANPAQYNQPANWRLWAANELCADLNPEDPEDADDFPPPIQLRIYRPQTSSGTTPGTWPSGRFPMLVFHHGVGQDPELYDHIFRPLVEDGFIVANVDITSNFATVAFQSEAAAAAMLCVIRYMTEEWADSEHAGCGLALMGHSRGAESAVLAIGGAHESGLELQAVISLAGRYNLGTVPVEYARPFLALASASDEDIFGDSTFSYDQMGVEIPPNGSAPKVVLRAYDVPHNAYGGHGSDFILSSEQVARSGLTPADYAAKGHAIASSYTRAFLRHHVLDRDAAVYDRFFRLRSFPEEIVEPSWWDYLDAYDQLDGGFDCAARSTEDQCLAAQGCRWVFVGCADVDCSSFNTAAACEEPGVCAWDGSACDAQPVIVGSWIDPVTEDRVVIDTFNQGQQFTTNLTGDGQFDEWSIDEVSVLGFGACDPEVGQAMACSNEDTRTYFSQGHDTNGLLLRADGISDGFVRWSLEGLSGQVGPLDAQGYTHARMRVGVRSSLLGPAIPPSGSANCQVAEPDPWTIGVQLANQNGQERTMTVRPLIQQDAIWATVNAINSQFLPVCAGDFFMQTIDVSLREFCDIPDPSGEPGFAIEALSSLAILLPAGNGPGEVIVDTIEIVTDPDPEAAQCTAASGMFACEAAQNLDVTLTTCSAEPQSGSCPSPAIIATPLSAPTVPVEWGGPFSGFVVHVPAGWVADDLENPTSTELEAITGLCEQACAQFYADDPHVTATCSASGAWQTPYLISSTSRGSIPRIPPEYEYGDGLWFEPQPLGCHLETGCTDSFDEELTRALPARPTPAAYPLGVGEKWRVEVSGTLNVMSIDDQVAYSESVVGSIGSSLCIEGTGEGPCPYYLGSFHVALADPLAIELDCDGAPVELTLDVVEIDLVQPAFGIDFEGNDWKAFPPGALLLRTHVESGLLTFDHVEANREKVYVNAGGSWMSAGPAQGIEVQFGVPCNGQTEGIKAWLTLTSGDSLGGPPEASIDMPRSVTCSTVVDLDVIASDVENDIVSVRWEVDGVLLDGGLDDLEITEAHEIRVIVRDARGATTNDTHLIDCS